MASETRVVEPPALSEPDDEVGEITSWATNPGIAARRLDRLPRSACPAPPTLRLTPRDLKSHGLIGRQRELAMLDRFLKRAAEGGESMILLGEPGVGKTALLAEVAKRARSRGARVLCANGVEFEAEVSFAALHQLLYPLLHQLLYPLLPEVAALPEPQREAIGVALGYGGGPPPGRLLVSHATFELLAHAASNQPLVVIVDDLAWLDRASAGVLSFVARRVAGTRLGFVGASRTGEESYFERAQLPELELPPLDEPAAADLMRREFPTLPVRVRERLLAEAQGNPLALSELPTALSESQRSRAMELPEVLPLTRRLEGLFASRVTRLPEETQEVLLLTALDGTGDLRILRRATPDGDVLDLLGTAERARLVHVDSSTQSLRLSHPLIRSAVVAMASPSERSRAHAKLASLRVDQPERRAWHLAATASEPDETVAALLEHAGHSSLHRGDAAGAIAALTRAAELSPHPSDRAKRLGQAAYVGAEAAGQLDHASVLLAAARAADPQDRGSLPAATAAVWLLLNGDGDVATAHRLLVGAIETFASDEDYEAADQGLIEAMLQLLLICWYGGRPELWGPFYRFLARLKLPPDALLQLVSDTCADPARTAACALASFDRAAAALPDEQDPAKIVRTGAAAIYLDRLGHVRAAEWRVVAQGRDGGTIRSYLGALMHLSLDDFLTGQWDEGVTLAAEGLSVCEEHGYGFFRWYFLYCQSQFAAARGQHDLTRELAEQITGWATPRGIRCAELCASYCRALSAIGRGDFEDAYRHATAVCPRGELPPYATQPLRVTFDLVEAAVRTGRQAVAEAHVLALNEARIGEISNRLALQVAGSAALTARDDAAVALFERAVSLPGAERWPFDLARVRLAFGEQLRRSRATVESRTQLRLALETFERLGARPWVNRAAGELRAAGRCERVAAPRNLDALTNQERQIALLAATGLTNKEIAGRMFLSPRTIGFHLHRAFPKLGISSRAALRDALDALPDEGRRLTRVPA